MGWSEGRAQVIGRREGRAQVIGWSKGRAQVISSECKHTTDPRSSGS